MFYSCIRATAGLADVLCAGRYFQNDRTRFGRLFEGSAASLSSSVCLPRPVWSSASHIYIRTYKYQLSTKIRFTFFDFYFFFSIFSHANNIIIIIMRVLRGTQVESWFIILTPRMIVTYVCFVRFRRRTRDHELGETELVRRQAEEQAEVHDPWRIRLWHNGKRVPPVWRVRLFF